MRVATTAPTTTTNENANPTPKTPAVDKEAERDAEMPILATTRDIRRAIWEEESTCITPLN
jgi:hypothetical protein